MGQGAPAPFKKQGAEALRFGGDENFSPAGK